MQSDPQPWAFFDLEIGIRRVDEVQLSFGMLAAKLAVPVLRRDAVRADLDYRNAVEDAPLSRGVRLERFDDQPLIRM
jgi:hypothetical protein